LIMKRIFLAFLFLLIASITAYGQGASTCTMTVTITNPLGQPLKGQRLRIVQTKKTGQAAARINTDTPASDASGLITFSLPNQAEVWIYGQVNVGNTYLGENGPSGVMFPISSPDNPCNLALESIAENVTVQPEGIAVYDETTPLPGKYGTIKFIGPGVTAARQSEGVLAVTITGGGGGGGSLTVKEVDGSPTVTSVDTIQFQQASGFVVTDQTGGAVRVDLAAIPYAKLNLTGAVVNADLAGSIANNKLANSTINIAGNSTALGGSVTQDQITGLASTGLVKRTGANALGIAAGGTDYEVPLTFSTGLTRSTNTVTVNAVQNITKLSNLTSNGFVKTSSSDGTLSVDTNTYLTANQTITLSGDASGSGSTSITTTLATVNSSPGSFGSASKSLSATVNGKGLITALSEQNIAIAESQVTNLVSDLAGKAASSHTHAAGDIVSGQLAIARGGTGTGTAPSDGKVLIGKTDGSYAVANLTAGANITITNADGGITIASSGGASGYATVQEEGSGLTQRATINFVGSGITAADNSGQSRTDVTLSAILNAVNDLSSQARLLRGRSRGRQMKSQSVMAMARAAIPRSACPRP
jgi:hypothetical protein